ncbi:hypothetical protein Mgra_00009544 [Meloidogyne graminicola]|uniref:ANK_REP_REGION domain-containing protein n=1 Tax=Meloidogyne graminicola TaxID=189291 RepID=A0A8S9ZBK1_9BILA|nr:hypothetical protein Mgra_00009544 [Meloidogyne graminicola]
MLLMEPDVRIGNALLVMCNCEVFIYKITISYRKIAEEMLGEETATSEYSSDISPVILAAHLNQFEILQMLL